LDYTEPEELVAMIFELAKKSTVPVAIHLDHGRTFETVMKFIRLGFSSVMIDGSLKPDGKTVRTYEENIEVTTKVVEAAHAVSVSVEGEIGRLGQIERDIDEAALTDPDEVARFVADTGVDLLAVSIGTRHGLFKGKPIIRHDRIAEIQEKVSIPMVMHGGTGVPDSDVQKAIQKGICKVNIDTQIRIAFYNAVKEQIEKKEKGFAEADTKGEVRKYDIREILQPARDAMQQAIAEKMRLFGSAGKA
jgi:fructose-bisphosphate aldolase class II